ncbi:MAG: NAD(+) synthase, partial [Muribaculaceae bacterium]|nr:NAD(+) synthase [Muribaculaceae bacterium]
MYEGFFRVAVASPAVVVADTVTNASNIIALMNQADKSDADLVVFPEMAVTGYTCGDLFHSETLLRGASAALEQIAQASAKCRGLVAVVGVPVRRGAKLFNCAAVVAQGSVRALVPKTYIPNYNEFYERRWFDAAPDDFVEPAFGTNVLVEHRGVKIGVEICEDLWTP